MKMMFKSKFIIKNHTKNLKSHIQLKIHYQYKEQDLGEMLFFAKNHFMHSVELLSGGRLLASHMFIVPLDGQCSGVPVSSFG